MVWALAFCSGLGISMAQDSRSRIARIHFLGVGFWAKNGDCCGDSAVTYALVCALARTYKAKISYQKSCRLLRAGLESTF